MEVCLNFLSPCVTIVLYIITFCIIDRKTKEKEKNKKELSFYLLNETYTECKWWVDVFEDEQFFRDTIIKKVDFDSANDEISRKLIDAPFDNEAILLNLVKDGQVDLSFTKDYYDIKSLYSKYTSVHITFFDHPEIYSVVKNELLEKIDSALKRVHKDYI